MLMTDSRQESVRLNCSLLMRQEVFCRNNGGLKSLLPRGRTSRRSHFRTTIFRVLNFYSMPQLFFHVPHPCSLLFRLDPSKTDARKTSPKLLPIQNPWLTQSNRKCNR